MSNDIETLASLATRLEQAGPESQAELLWELWELANWSNDYANFINCGAYLSAVEMLVPEGKTWGAYYDPRLSRSYIGDLDGFNQVHTLAETPALALAAASVRAIAGKEN